MDVEGVELGKSGEVCLMQIMVEETVETEIKDGPFCLDPAHRDQNPDVYNQIHEYTGSSTSSSCVSNTASTTISISPPTTLKTEKTVYLVDLVELQKKAFDDDICYPNLKTVLESEQCQKVLFDCRQDFEAVFFHFGVMPRNVYDLQISFLLSESVGQNYARHLKGLPKALGAYFDEATSSTTPAPSCSHTTGRSGASPGPNSVQPHLLEDASRTSRDHQVVPPEKHAASSNAHHEKSSQEEEQMNLQQNNAHHQEVNLGDVFSDLKERGKALYDPRRGGGYHVWAERPMQGILLAYAAVDVSYLLAMKRHFESLFVSRVVGLSRAVAMFEANTSKEKPEEREKRLQEEQRERFKNAVLIRTVERILCKLANPERDLGSLIDFATLAGSSAVERAIYETLWGGSYKEDQNFVKTLSGGLFEHVRKAILLGYEEKRENEVVLLLAAEEQKSKQDGTSTTCRADGHDLESDHSQAASVEDILAAGGTRPQESSAANNESHVNIQLEEPNSMLSALTETSNEEDSFEEFLKTTLNVGPQEPVTVSGKNGAAKTTSSSAAAAPLLQKLQAYLFDHLRPCDFSPKGRAVLQEHYDGYGMEEVVNALHYVSSTFEKYKARVVQDRHFWTERMLQKNLKWLDQREQQRQWEEQQREHWEQEQRQYDNNFHYDQQQQGQGSYNSYHNVGYSGYNNHSQAATPTPSAASSYTPSNQYEQYNHQQHIAPVAEQHYYALGSGGEGASTYGSPSPYSLDNGESPAATGGGAWGV
ncbi:unnamed protein product [Amoebophrya sp. A120]|nr:unnamed protein product [Amoebophrya sp. A120]|eukprot:GSA120T00016386001.1